MSGSVKESDSEMLCCWLWKWRKGPQSKKCRWSQSWKMQGNGFSPSISSRTHSCGHFHFSLVRPDRTSDLQPGLQNPGKVLRSGCPECFRTGAAKSKRPRVRKIRHIPIISRGLLTSLDCEGRGEVIGGGWDSIKISLQVQEKGFGFILNETGSFQRVLRGQR